MRSNLSPEIGDRRPKTSAEERPPGVLVGLQFRAVYPRGSRRRGRRGPRRHDHLFGVCSNIKRKIPVLEGGGTFEAAPLGESAPADSATDPWMRSWLPEGSQIEELPFDKGQNRT